MKKRRKPEQLLESAFSACLSSPLGKSPFAEKEEGKDLCIRTYVVRGVGSCCTKVQYKSRKSVYYYLHCASIVHRI